MVPITIPREGQTSRVSVLSTLDSESLNLAFQKFLRFC